MRRSLMIAVAASMLATAIPGAAGAAVKEGSAQIVSSVSFRTAPSTSSDVMRYLKKGETVAVLEETNAYWLKVRDSSGTVGYVSSRDQYVSLTAAPTETADAAVGAANATIVASVNFRNAPSTSGDRIRYLAKGEQVTVTSQVNSYWYAVTDASGVSGYVSTSSSYIKLTGAIAGSGSANSGSGTSNSGTGSSNSDSGTGVSASAKIEAVIAAGMAYLGTPYEYGSDRSTTTTFDCSDFVRQAFKDALGVTLPADSSSQGAYVRGLSSVTTDWKQLKRGDLMFFMDYKGTSASLYTNKSAFGSSISHVAIYLGNGQVLHTYSKESGGVRVDSIKGVIGSIGSSTGAARFSV